MKDADGLRVGMKNADEASTDPLDRSSPHIFKNSPPCSDALGTGAC